MKLSYKFIISSIFIVAVAMAATFFLIEQKTNDEFKKFAIEKIKEGKFQNKDKSSRPNQPNNFNDIQFAPDSPEARFVKATRDTLLSAFIIGVLLAIVISFVTSKLMLSKISRLRYAMDEYMKKGKLKKVTHSNSDEIDKLSEVYNLLIEKIDKQENIRKEFFIDMSHELKTPLTAIKGYLEGINDKVFTIDKEKEIQKKALLETNRMVHLIKEMTILAKTESDNQELLKEKVSLEDISKEVIFLFKNEAEKKEMKFEIIGGVTAEVNRDKFKQIMINLLDNAINYGEARSLIKIEMENENGKAFWIIKNKTLGILQKDLDYMFERFYRSDKSRSYDGKRLHLGVGLNIVKKLVELHGGKIIASLKDGWITFEVIV